MVVCVWVGKLHCFTGYSGENGSDKQSLTEEREIYAEKHFVYCFKKIFSILKKCGVFIIFI